MKVQMKAVEVAGIIDEQGRLHVEEPLSNLGVGPVRVMVLIPEGGEDINEGEWLRSMTSNPAFDFLNDPDEDIYTLEDGKPFRNEG